MKTITQISVQQKNKNRSNVYLDGVYYCSLDNFTVLSCRLKVGMQIDEPALEKIQEENELEQAFNKGLSYALRYQKSKKKVSEYLSGKGYSYPVVFKVIERLVGYGYIDDNASATRYVESASSKKGKKLLLANLRAKGYDEKTANKAINAIKDEFPSAKALAEKYMKNKENTYENRCKCYRHILSKGFGYDVAKRAVSAIAGVDDDN